MNLKYKYIFSIILILTIKKTSTAIPQETETAYQENQPVLAEFSSTPHVVQYENDLVNDCYRDCEGDTIIKQCYYKFKAEWYITMSKACFNCPFNITDCLRPHCVAADGREKGIVTVNRRLPGPSIQVCENDEIIVDVENDLGSDTTTIHWHGVHQIGTPYMDGVPFLTQCPIHSGTSFRYHFIAEPAGTHYWHSHSGLQRADGMFGSLVVRSRLDPQRFLYDVDDPEHVIVVTDWMDKIGVVKFVNHHHTVHENKPYNILVNGFGKHKPLQEDGKTAYTPLYEFVVKPNLRYRFRSISNSIQNCPIIISVDNHTLLVIASDGQRIKPLEVDTLIIYAGERWDFVVNANQTPGVYWMKFNGLLDCDDRYFAAHQVAVFRYEGYSGFPNTPDEISYEFTKRNGLQLNNLNAAPGDLTTFYSVDQLKSQDVLVEPSPYAREPDYKFWLEFDFYALDNDRFHNKQFYAFFGVEYYYRLYLPQINHITHQFPNVPPLSQPDEVNQTHFCSQGSLKRCQTGLCQCPHVLNVELGSLVEFILVDTGVVYFANHPFHLHGYAFAVLGMERLGDNTTIDAVKNLDSTGKLKRNLENPPIKDTVTVPDGGYTVIRFIADNPGYWFFHCHLTFHVETGMGLIVHVGDRNDLPAVPPGFPKCGSWLPIPAPDLHSKIHKNENGLVILDITSNNQNEFVSYNHSDVAEEKPKSSQLGGSGAIKSSLILIELFLILVTLLWE